MTVGFYTLGCKTNAYDTQAMREIMLSAGYDEVPFEQADICIINTCTVTSVADKKSRQMINRALRRGAKVIAAGCMAQKEGDALRDMGAFAVVGTSERARIAEIAAGGAAHIADIRSDGGFEELFVSRSDERVRAYLKVQEGCDNFCTYCTIPFVRGRSRSRDFRSAVLEAERLCAAGYREIVVTGIHIDDYFCGGKRLIDLLEEMGRRIPQCRIRLGSLHIACMEGDFLQRAKHIENLCPHFHLSLQSGSAEVLAAMGRRYTPDQYYDTVLRIREDFDLPAITTDIIAGFPGESIEQHEQTKAFIEKCGFARVHVFPYSARKGTVAAAMSAQIPRAEKERRARELICAAAKCEDAYISRFIGREVSVLLEQPCEDEPGYLSGYTKEYVRCIARGYADEIKTAVPLRAENGCLMIEQ